MSRFGLIGATALFVCLIVLPTAACGDLSPRVGPLVTADACTDDAGAGCGTPIDEGGTDSGLISFKRDIRPLMDRHQAGDPTGIGCRDCHYNTSPTPIGIYQARLDMTTLGSLRKGGTTTGTKIVVPGDPESSGIIKKLRGTYPTGKRMPFSGPPYWTDAQIQLMADWIAQGALGEDSE